MTNYKSLNHFFLLLPSCSFTRAFSTTYVCMCMVFFSSVSFYERSECLKDLRCSKIVSESRFLVCFTHCCCCCCRSPLIYGIRFSATHESYFTTECSGMEFKRGLLNWNKKSKKIRVLSPIPVKPKWKKVKQKPFFTISKIENNELIFSESSLATVDFILWNPIIIGISMAFSAA